MARGGDIRRFLDAVGALTKMVASTCSERAWPCTALCMFSQTVSNAIWPGVSGVCRRVCTLVYMAYISMASLVRRTGVSSVGSHRKNACGVRLDRGIPRRVVAARLVISQKR